MDMDISPDGTVAPEGPAKMLLAQLAQLQAEIEQEARARAVAEAQLAAQNVSVRDCIRGAPVTSKPVLPKWGDRLSGDSSSTTKTSTAWLHVGPDHVDRWTDKEFIEYLDKADGVVTDEGTSVLQLILDGRTDPTIANVLRGVTLGANTTLRVAEAEVKDLLRGTLWQALEQIMGRSTLDLERYPVANYIDTRVTVGAANDPLVPMAFASLFKVDRLIESRWRKKFSAEYTFPSFLDNFQKQSPLLKFSSRTVLEIKPDYKCPKLRQKGYEDDAVAAIGGDIVDYIKSAFFDAKFNPIAQVVTYGLATRTSMVAVCTINRMTYGLIGDDRHADLSASEADCLPVTKLTRTFDWTSNTAPLPDRPDWSHVEILIRYILASFGTWYRETVSDALKLIFKKRKDGHGNRETETGTATHSDSEGSHVTAVELTRDDSPKPFSLPRLYWEDLWDAVRFAIPATDRDLEASSQRLPGDAELIAEGRIGPVFRKKLYGVDAVIKVLPFLKYSCSGEREHPDRDELYHEFQVYSRLTNLQGKVIPRLLWYGEIAEDVADALVTEYGGTSLERLFESEDELNKVQAQQVQQQALHALREMHDAGVLHGDAEARNVVWQRQSDGGGRVLFVDLGMAQFRDDMSEGEWMTAILSEIDALMKDIASQRRSVD